MTDLHRLAADLEEVRQIRQALDVQFLIDRGMVAVKCVDRAQVDRLRALLTPDELVRVQFSWLDPEP